MFITTGLFLSGLFGKTVSDKAAKVIGIGALILVALIAGSIWLSIRDSNLIDRHDAEQEAEMTNAVLAAERKANAEKQMRDQVFELGQDNITASIGNAVAADPVATRKPVGPASQAYYDTLRREQQAKEKK